MMQYSISNTFSVQKTAEPPLTMGNTLLPFREQYLADCLGCQILHLTSCRHSSSMLSVATGSDCAVRILVVIKGAATLQQVNLRQTNSQPIQAGQSAVIFTEHSSRDRFYIEDCSELELLDIRFDCSNLRTVYHQLAKRLCSLCINPLGQPKTIMIPTCEKLNALSHSIISVTEQHRWDSNDQLYLASLAYQSLSQIISQRHNQNSEDKPSNQILSQRVILKVRQAYSLLTQSPEQDWSIKKLSRQAGTNETTLKNGFKQLYQNSFSQILRESRMNMAADALRYSQEPIINIAINVGYASPSHFTKIFKQSYNITPAAYRKQLTRKSN